MKEKEKDEEAEGLEALLLSVLRFLLTSFRDSSSPSPPPPPLSRVILSAFGGFIYRISQTEQWIRSVLACGGINQELSRASRRLNNRDLRDKR